MKFNALVALNLLHVISSGLAFEVSKLKDNVTFTDTGFASTAGKVFFIAYEEDTGIELWSTDGTSEGTGIVKDIAPGPELSGFENYIPFPGMSAYLGEDRLVFFADDGVTGKELWATDGSNEGTILVKDINEGEGSSYIYKTQSFGKIAGDDATLYFYTVDIDGNEALWVTDGTSDGTQPAPTGTGSWLDAIDTSRLDFGKLFQEVNGRTFFEAYENADAFSPSVFATDGTLEGTTRIISGGAKEMAMFEDRFFYIGLFSGLYSSDGTEEGTIQIVPPECPSFETYSSLTVLSGGLLFTCGCKLYRTDGTVDGTVLLADRTTGALCSHVITPLGEDKAIVQLDEAPRPRPWVTNGTPEGTMLLVNATMAFDIGAVVVVNENMAVFVTRHPSEDFGHGLWSTNGTPQGTELIDVGRDEDGFYSHIGDLAAFGGDVFATIWYSIGPGRELWKVTVPKTDTVQPGAPSLEPTQPSVAPDPLVNDTIVSPTDPVEEMTSSPAAQSDQPSAVPTRMLLSDPPSSLPSQDESSDPPSGVPSGTSDPPSAVPSQVFSDPPSTAPSLEMPTLPSLLPVLAATNPPSVAPISPVTNPQTPTNDEVEISTSATYSSAHGFIATLFSSAVYAFIF